MIILIPANKGEMNFRDSASRNKSMKIAIACVSEINYYSVQMKSEEMGESLHIKLSFSHAGPDTYLVLWAENRDQHHPLTPPSSGTLQNIEVK